MINASSPDGSCTMTGWKRRSKAESFSKYLRCSSRVVAPMQCNWPLARAGFIKLLMSRPPLRTDPPPTSMWISSILHHHKKVSSGIASAKPNIVISLWLILMHSGFDCETKVFSSVVIQPADILAQTIGKAGPAHRNNLHNIARS